MVLLQMLQCESKAPVISRKIPIRPMKLKTNKTLAVTVSHPKTEKVGEMPIPPHSHHALPLHIIKGWPPAP